MKQPILTAINSAFNRYLKLDPASTDRLSKLQGKTIAIECLPLSFTFYCQFTQASMQIHTDQPLTVDATIRGTPMQMMGVMLSPENRHRFFADDLVIEGDAEFGQQVVKLFDELNIDWEEHCSQLIGDVPAYRLGQLTRRISAVLTHIGRSFTQNLNEYVHEEANWFPAREALQDFFDDIDTIRMDVDRAEARITQLKQQINQREELQ